MGNEFESQNYRGGHQHNEMKQKWKKSGYFTLCLLICMAIIYAITSVAMLNAKDIKLKNKGNSISIEQVAGKTYEGKDEQGNKTILEYSDKTFKVTRPTYANTGSSTNSGVNAVANSVKTPSGKEYRTYEKNLNVGFVDDAGAIHVVSKLIFMNPIKDKDTIKLYYYENDLDGARPLFALWFWFLLYGFLIFALVICIMVAYRIKFPKTHLKSIYNEYSEQDLKEEV